MMLQSIVLCRKGSSSPLPTTIHRRVVNLYYSSFKKQQQQRYASSSSSSSAMTLNYEVIGHTNNKTSSSSSSVSSGSTGNIQSKSGSSGSILFLHGLLGNGRNLNTFARKVCQQQSMKGYLVDLRGHGKSRIIKNNTTTTTTTTFDDCIHDIKRTITTMAQEEADNKKNTEEGENNTQHHHHYYPHTIVGHSWGGRMALQYAATATSSNSSSDHQHHYHHNNHNLQRVWLLDTVPGQANESVEKVISAVTDIVRSRKQYTDRKQLIIELQSKGLDLATSQWLASSYKTKKTGDSDFGFDLDVINDILPEFGNQDFFGLLEMAIINNNNADEKKLRIDLVRGGKNTGWNDNPQTLKDLYDFQNTYKENFNVHVLHNAGHWVHVDDLHGLVNLIR